MSGELRQALRRPGRQAVAQALFGLAAGVLIVVVVSILLQLRQLAIEQRDNFERERIERIIVNACQDKAGVQNARVIQACVTEKMERRE